MSYEIAQNLLTASYEIVAIAGLTGIIAHAFYSQHKRFMSTYCPPVAPYVAPPEAEVAEDSPVPEILPL